MNLITAFTLFLSGMTAQVQGQGGSRRHNAHMWMFGANGVQVYTADGSTLVKDTPPAKICKDTIRDTGEIRVRCDFNDVVSDGKKYVWAAVARGIPKIDVFRIDTGDLVGSFATCGDPRELDYHPLREEVWVHCSSFNNETESQSHMDVFSAVSPTATIPVTIKMHDNTLLRSDGKLKVAAELGEYAYGTVPGQSYLYKINMAQRSVEEKYLIDVPDNDRFFGLYDMAYSPKNNHFFLRAQICCTCGFEGADDLECGHYGSNNITLPDGTETEGMCGRHCRGKPKDNIGIMEFDTATGKIIGTHPFQGSAPVYAPFASPDGEHIILFGMDGGKTVDILKAGSSGFKSKLEMTLKLDFNTTNVDDDEVFHDFAYIQEDDMNLFVVSSSSDYKVAIVDMASPDKTTSYVMLKDKDVHFLDRPRSRQIEHVEGTDYVWIGGRRQEEAYVINVRTKKLVRTFMEVDARRLLSVKHHAFFQQVADFGKYMTQEGMLSNAEVQTVEEEASKDLKDAETAPSDVSRGSASVSAQAASANDDEVEKEDDSDINAMSVAALALSCVAIAAVLANVVVMNNAKSSNLGGQGRALTGDAEDPSVSQPPSVQ